MSCSPRNRVFGACFIRVEIDEDLLRSCICPFVDPSLVHVEQKLGWDVVEDSGLRDVTDKLLVTHCQPSRVFRIGGDRLGNAGLCEHFLECVLGDRLVVQTLQLLNGIGQRERVVLFDCSVNPSTKVLKVRLAEAGEASSLFMAIVSALDNVSNNKVVDAEEPGDLGVGDREDPEPLLGERVLGECDLHAQGVALQQAGFRFTTRENINYVTFDMNSVDLPEGFKLPVDDQPRPPRARPSVPSEPSLSIF